MGPKKTELSQPNKGAINKIDPTATDFSTATENSACDGGVPFKHVSFHPLSLP